MGRSRQLCCPPHNRHRRVGNGVNGMNQYAAAMGVPTATGTMFPRNHMDSGDSVVRGQTLFAGTGRGQPAHFSKRNRMSPTIIFCIQRYTVDVGGFMR